MSPRKKPKPKDQPPLVLPEHITPVTDTSALETVRRGAGDAAAELDDFQLGAVIARAGGISGAVVLLNQHPVPDWVGEYAELEPA